MVKLTRTLVIIPITLVLACWQMHLARKAGGDAKSTFSLKRAFPMFVLFFVLASVITTVLQLPVSITAPIKELSKFFIVMAMAAIGFNTDIVELVKKGGKPIALGLCGWSGIACMRLGMQPVLGIWSRGSLFACWLLVSTCLRWSDRSSCGYGLSAGL